MRNRFFWLLAALSLSARAAELKFDFSEFPANQTPPGFRSTLLGQGKPGDWKTLLDEVPPLLEPLTPKAPAVTRRAVLAQLSQDPTDERFPLLIYEGATFGDFALTTKFKIVSGGLEQMAGVAFRIQNESNFYVIRASALGNNIRFYKVVNGERGNLIGPEIEIPKGVWQELTVECKGNQIRCQFNGKEAIPPLTDNTFSKGKIGFWTKSDSVSYFGNTKLTYTPRELAAQVIVRDTVKKYARLVALKIYVLNDKGEPRLIASKTESEIGEVGGAAEKDVIAHDTIYYGKDKDTVAVSMPLRDRNGEPIATVRVVMKSFVGQTEQNALARAMPIVKEMQARIQTLQELTQ
jgi:hypothetical protein